MTRQFSNADVSRTTRIMQALLPDGVTAQATAVSSGFEISISICGATSCETATFSGSMTDRHLLILAESWKLGVFNPPTDYDEHSANVARAMKAEAITTRNDLMAWIRTAKKGAKISYFKGNLAQFRHDAAPRILKLQSLADAAKKARPRPTTEAVELNHLQETQELLAAISHLTNSQSIELVQHRIPDGTGATYYAIKR